MSKPKQLLAHCLNESYVIRVFGLHNTSQQSYCKDLTTFHVAIFHPVHIRICQHGIKFHALSKDYCPLPWVHAVVADQDF